MDEAAGLWALPTVVLPRGQVYEAQHHALILFAKVIPAKDVAELAAAQSHSRMCEHAYRLWKGSSVLAGILDFLWKPRQGEIPPK
jgi:hypothetical protein